MMMTSDENAYVEGSPNTCGRRKSIQGRMGNSLNEEDIKNEPMMMVFSGKDRSNIVEITQDRRSSTQSMKIETEENHQQELVLENSFENEDDAKVEINGVSYVMTIDTADEGETFIVSYCHIDNPIAFKTIHIKKDLISKMDSDKEILESPKSALKKHAATLFELDASSSHSVSEISRPKRRPPSAPVDASPLVMKRLPKEVMIPKLEHDAIVRDLEKRIADIDMERVTLKLEATKIDNTAVDMDEMRQLKNQLLDKDSEIAALKHTIVDQKKEIEKTVVECEEIIQDLRVQNESEVAKRDLELKHLEVRNDTLDAIIDETRTRYLEAEEKLKVSREEIERAEKRTQELQSVISEIEKLSEAEAEKSRTMIKDLETQLAEMTESKQSHKEYGAAMKSKLIDLQQTFHDKASALEADNQDLKTRLETLQGEHSELQTTYVQMQETEKKLVEEQDALNKEIEKLTAECECVNHANDKLQKRCTEVEANVAELSTQRDTMIRERKERIVEFENQLQREKIRHAEEIAKLKAHAYDSAEKLKIKEAEVEELSQYVTKLLDEKET